MQHAGSGQYYSDHEILSVNGAAAALMLSDIPWNGPIGACMHVCMCVKVHTCILCVCMCVKVHTCVCVYMCVCMPLCVE